ncbi:MAG: hypothetical protein M1453_04040 [Acidobacteria bacterium]|nr:hypothetical protein [Acidobacteriota bacterium]MCL5287150.1 hypothetical protein [Acidobacteriota bacterium]
MKPKTGILVTILALVLAAAAPLVAGGDEKELWAKLKQGLTLSDSQVTQLQQKFEALRTQGQSFEKRAQSLKAEIDALEKAATPDANALSAKRAELASLKAEWKEKAMQIYQSVLTSEQFTKLQQMYSDEAKKKEYEKKKKN